MIEDVVTVSIIIAYFLAVIFAAYTITIIIPYLRRQKWKTGNPQDFRWHFLVPCRDEEAVIRGTASYLLHHYPEADIWVIDDDSDDATRDIVRELQEGTDRLHLIERKRPNARLGKAQSLNYAWSIVRAGIEERNGSFSREVVVVVDADGRPSPNFLQVLAGEGCFGDPEVSLVQVEVQMRNRNEKKPVPDGDWLTNLLAHLFIRMQDIEFRGPISATQMTRRATNTVNAGGNGQATRASALARINQGDGPWGESLVEDLELGLHILFDGGKNAYTTDAYVDQEALYSLQRYLVQRARWSRGTMQCSEYIPRVWRTPQITNLGAMEMTFFLVQPWNQLVGSIVFPIPLIAFLYALVKVPNFAENFASRGGWIILGTILLIGMVEFALWGILYWAKCERKKPAWLSLVWGLSYLIYVYINYPVVWRAFIQLFTGKQGWAKTRRNAEVSVPVSETARFD